MVLRLEQMPRIEALRSYPMGTADRLSQLLALGAPARPDPRREGFFEIDSDSEVFYVHISPLNGRVLLIGIWQKPAEPCLSQTASQVA
jgi:hypothetical protein